ncbi:hypothetical protein CVT25_010279 [Psilocybe cyanescens]|uniref:Uncharacterized protein n=1 Tax=Psilocybe cyanescens TaxID=93625 RepID=A0A409X2T3_PSICY|nr:hypothetical protein CVT25_010279 [Psilocybe cyanescens]
MELLRELGAMGRNVRACKLWERDELKEEVGMLVERVQVEHDYKKWPVSYEGPGITVHQPTLPHRFHSHPHSTISLSHPSSITPSLYPYAPQVTHLSTQLSTEQAAHAHTQGRTAALGAHVARREVVLERDEAEMEEEHITAILDMTVARNRMLESEISGLSARFSLSFSFSFPLSLTRRRHLHLWLPPLLLHRHLYTIYVDRNNHTLTSHLARPSHGFFHLPERDMDMGMGVDADSAKPHSEEGLARRSRQSHQHEDQSAYAEQDDGDRGRRGRSTSPLGVPVIGLRLGEEKEHEREIVFAQRNTNANANALNGTGSSDMAMSMSASVSGDGCSVSVRPSAPLASVPVPALPPVHVPNMPNLTHADNEDGDADGEIPMELAMPLMRTGVISMSLLDSERVEEEEEEVGGRDGDHQGDCAVHLRQSLDEGHGRGLEVGIRIIQTMKIRVAIIKTNINMKMDSRKSLMALTMTMVVMRISEVEM